MAWIMGPTESFVRLRICRKCLPRRGTRFLLEKIISKCQLSYQIQIKTHQCQRASHQKHDLANQLYRTFIGLGKMSLDLAEDWRVIRASSRVTECAGGEIINCQYLNILYFPVDTVILSHRLIPGKNILDTLYRLWTNWRPVSRSSDHYQPISIWSWTLYIDSAASAATCDCSN